MDEEALAGDTEEYLKGQAQAAVQSLINRWVVLVLLLLLLRAFPSASELLKNRS